MKLKHILTLLGVSFSLAAVGAVGVAAGEKWAEKDENLVAEVKADNVGPWYVAGSFSGVNKWALSNAYLMTETSTGVWTKENLTISDGDEIKIAPTSGDWQGGWGFNNGDSSSTIKTYFTASGNDSNIVCHHTGVYTVTLTLSDYHILIEEVSVTTHIVGFDEDGDGTADKEFEVVDGETAESYTPYIFGKVFGAWQLSGVNYDFSTAVTADITLTATWTDRTGDVGYIYIITGYGASWTSRYIYGYGSAEGYGAWKGCLVEDIKVGVTGTTNFGGGNNTYANGGIFKVPYYKADAMTNIVLHNNGSDSDRSGDLPFGEGYGYFFKNNPWDDEKSTFDSAALASIGKAAAFVFEFDELLSGKDFCKTLDAEECATLYNKYLAAIENDNTAKGWIDSSCINTSNGGDNVNLSVILPEIYKIAVRGGELTLNFTSPIETNSNNAGLLILITSVSALSFVGFIVIKRRKENN